VSYASSGNIEPFGCSAVCLIAVAIGSYEGPSNKSESVEARYPDIFLSDLRSAIATSRKSGYTKNGS